MGDDHWRDSKGRDYRYRDIDTLGEQLDNPRNLSQHSSGVLAQGIANTRADSARSDQNGIVQGAAGINREGVPPLRLQTDVNDFPIVNMLPTPLLNTEGSWPQVQPIARNVSASIVPDPINKENDNLTDQEMSPASPTAISRLPAAHLGRSDTLKIPKRRNLNGLQLGRSLSVGGPQRSPSTILHREPKIGTIIETLPADVYVATTPMGEQTAWSRVKVAGKGSFSEVILARPAVEFVQPELVDEIETIAEHQIAELETDYTHKCERNVLVAVKITALNHARADAELQLFKRDLDIMSKLPHHPSLMRLIAWSLDEEIHKRALFVLPYCCGGDLFDLVARHRSKLSSMLIRRLFADVCSAVVFLHRNMIVHRDIKLENVLLDVSVSQLLNLAEPNKYEGPLAVLTDLGLARRIDPVNVMLTTRCGSDDYVPPEIMMGQPYDGRETDSWALGVLLYAMMEGRLPFDAPPHITHHEGSRARLRVAHRIARVDWSWYKRSDLGPEDQEWQGGKEVVDGCLKRRHQRRLASDTLQLPWVADAIGPVIHESHDEDDEIWKIFVQ